MEINKGLILLLINKNIEECEKHLESCKTSKDRVKMKAYCAGAVSTLNMLLDLMEEKKDDSN